MFSATYTRILARTLGLQRDQLKPLVRNTQLSAEEIEFEKRALTADEQYTVISNAISLSDAECLGLQVGEASELSAHGILGLASMSADTLNEVLEIFIKYQKVRAPFFDFKLEKTNEKLVVSLKTLASVPESVNRFLLEAGCSMLQSIVEQIVGRKVTEAILTLPFTNQAPFATYQKYFNGSVKRSKDEYARYSIPLTLSQSINPARDDILHQRAEEGCKTLLAELDGQSTIAGKVEALLTDNEGAYLTLEDCAVLLNMSPRTLIRKLREEGVFFRKIIEERKKIRASQLLANQTLSVEAVALTLGYDHTANFRRAFKRWYGVPPSEYRKSL